MRSIEDMVGDWGGFERLIADLHDTGSVTVEHDVILPGRSGAPRQIDVLVRHRQGLYEHLVVVECKYRNTAVERLHVDALATTVREVGADKGVIMSTQGFQKGAVTQAKHDNISLFQIREPSAEEWGLPGRHIDLWLQAIALSIGPVMFPGSGFQGVPPADPTLALRLGGGLEHESRTPIENTGRAEPTLERLIDRLARDAAKIAWKPCRIAFESGADEGEHCARFKVNFAPPVPVRAPQPTGALILPRIEFDVGLTISQGRLQIDRAANYAFVLAVEDCVNKVVSTASRVRDEATTVICPPRSEAVDPEDIYQNGSVAQIWLEGFTDFAPFEASPPQ